MDALKTSEGAGASYIVYVIHFEVGFTFLNGDDAVVSSEGFRQILIRSSRSTSNHVVDTQISFPFDKLFVHFILV